MGQLLLVFSKKMVEKNFFFQKFLKMIFMELGDVFNTNFFFDPCTTPRAQQKFEKKNLKKTFFQKFINMIFMEFGAVFITKFFDPCTPPHALDQKK